MPEEIKLPIAEIFTSIHGEGRWAGTRMTFIRLAGCTVGKVFPSDYEGNASGCAELVILPSGKEASMCTTFDDRTFPCDTDYSRTESLTLNEIWNRIPTRVEHVCITGGEPLMHKNLLDLCNYLSKFYLHIETSGTIEFPDWPPSTYVACSPKVGYIPEMVHKADEVRIMADKNLTIESVRLLILHCNYKYQDIYFSPLCIGETTEPDRESLAVCMDFVSLFPKTKVSIQMHKVLGVR